MNPSEAKSQANLNLSSTNRAEHHLNPLTRANELRDLIDRANHAYYQEVAPFISDKEFDEALKELSKLESAYNLDTTGSPTQRVGGEPTEEFNTVHHPVPLLSLDNTYNEEELRDFDKRVCRVRFKAD